MIWVRFSSGHFGTRINGGNKYKGKTIELQILRERKRKKNCERERKKNLERERKESTF